MTSMNKKAALFYASLGWPVFPVWPIRAGKCACKTNCGKDAGKHPIAKFNGQVIAPSGLRDATTSSKKITGWWDLIPDANIAAVGFKWFAIDIDDQDAFEMVTDEYGPLPDTVEQFSGGGGRHLLFNQPEKKLGSARGQLPAGIDVRGYNGYILLAPSTHVDGEYEWEVSSRPSVHPIADAPDWLIELIGGTNEVKFEGTVTTLDWTRLDISQSTIDRIVTPPDYDSDRSATDQRVINALVEAGATDDEIRHVYSTYPIGTQGKYAEKGTHGDNYLAITISKARAYVKSPSVRISKAIPGKIITPDEAEIEAITLGEIYEKGWQDALTGNPELIKAMWPKYIGFDDQGLASTIVGLYGLGLRQDFHLSDDDEREFPALVVPIRTDQGKLVNLDYSIYGAKGEDRRLEQQVAPMFLADPTTIGRPRLLILDDWDVAAFVYLKLSHKLPKDIAITALTSDASAGMQASQLGPLLALAEQSEQVVFVTHLTKRNNAHTLASHVGYEKSRWIGWPLDSREMFTLAGMDETKLKRALRAAIPVG